MKSEKFDNNRETAKKTHSTPPAVELLLDPAQAGATWPENIASNEVFLKQLRARRELNKRLDEVLSRLPRPDISLQEAISQNYLTEAQVVDLYVSLNELLDEGSDYSRIVLYIPFEFLPNTAWEPSSEDLQHEMKRFRSTYMAAWDRLLSVHDVRANFVDGDVLDVESRVVDLPRVVKAAHLIPKLVENGLMKIDDVFKLLETSEDETLRQSIADTLPILADLGFIQGAERARMEASNDPLVRNTALLISSSEGRIEKKETTEPEPQEITSSLIQHKLDGEFDRIKSERYDDITKKRTEWLMQDKKQKAIESAGDEISAAIAKNTFTDEIAAKFAAVETPLAIQQTFVDGIRKTIEFAAHTDAHRAQSLYARYRNTLLSLWERNIPEVRDGLSKTFCRLHGLGVVDDEQLVALGITIPALAGPFSENIKTMDEEIGDVRKIILSIESDPELSRQIYPVALVFGSRLKGYGAKNADIDMGVFVRPGTPHGERGKLQVSLKKIFDHEKIQGEVVEFWLEETEDGLGVHDFEKSEPSLGESSWTHVLFGAAWEGDAGAINELREKLLAPYFYDKKKTIHGRDARGLYLEEMERDTLQYRLMHKGYERFFPSYGGMHTPHSDQIDGKSAFWDSGYRQMATKLFASRVFLPKISSKK